MIDLQQVLLAIRSASSRTLLLIDEFGKGTESKGTYLYATMKKTIKVIRRVGTVQGFD